MTMATAGPGRNQPHRMRVSRKRPGAALVPSSVVTIGGFDGVHLGHDALIERCQALKSGGDKVTVVTFEPLPRAFFDPAHAPPRLSSPVDKLRLLRRAGVDFTWMMRFDASLARVSSVEFAERVLVRGLGARQVVTGVDFRFGHRREGDLDLMRRLGERHGFAVSVVDTVTVAGRRVSSGNIRAALAGGELELAAAMLGRPYTMCGRVLRGQQLGRRLGYPTANLKVRNLPCPLQGIFAAEARVAGEGWKPAVASLGRRPAVGGEDLLLEVHFFDVDEVFYGRWLEVRFVAKLRDESHFENIDELIRQMKRDEAEARTILGRGAWTTKTQ